jgi:hypothetical protein
MINHSPPCSECGTISRLTTGEHIYPDRHELHHRYYWKCPNCKAYTGTQYDTTIPIGTPAGLRTRQSRMDAHFAFDRLWKHGFMTRSEAYEWLAVVMGLEPKDCHIGLMNLKQANRVITLANKKFAAALMEQQKKRMSDH